jgi:hypothetical protein
VLQCNCANCQKLNAQAVVNHVRHGVFAEDLAARLHRAITPFIGRAFDMNTSLALKRTIEDVLDKEK